MSLVAGGIPLTKRPVRVSLSLEREGTYIKHCLNCECATAARSMCLHIKYRRQHRNCAWKKAKSSVVGKWNLRSCLLPAKLAFLAKLVQIGVKLCEFWVFISNKCAILFILRENSQNSCFLL